MSYNSLCKIEEDAELSGDSSESELYSDSMESEYKALPWRATVFGSTVVLDADACAFVQYKIRVTVSKDGDDTSQWLVRRFSEFHELHQRLRSDRWVDLPRLPSRFGLGFLDPLERTFRKRREADLQQYLDQLVTVLPDMNDSMILQSFLTAPSR